MTTHYVPGLDDPGTLHALEDRSLRLTVSLHRDDRSFHLMILNVACVIELATFWPHFGWGSLWEHHDHNGRKRP